MVHSLSELFCRVAVNSEELLELEESCMREAIGGGKTGVVMVEIARSRGRVSTEAGKAVKRRGNQ